jgi:hypothetical protein
VIQHSEDDGTVPFSEGLALWNNLRPEVRALSLFQSYADLLLPGGTVEEDPDHGLVSSRATDVFPSMLEFFDERLGLEPSPSPAVDDAVTIGNTLHASHTLNVLANDNLPAGWRIVSATNGGHGKVAVAPDGRSLVYTFMDYVEPVNDSPFRGVEYITYTLGDASAPPPGGAAPGAVATVALTIGDDPGLLRVATFTATSTGFVVRFNGPADVGQINLYDTQTGGLGQADVTLVGAATGAVRGTLVLDPDGMAVTFIRTGGELLPDTYTVTLRSASNGFRATTGTLLDGNADGTPGDNYTATFAVAPSTAVSVRVPDFMRGPGQLVQIAPSSGLPLRLSNGAGVTSVSFTLRYDPALLAITGAAAGALVPPGATVMLNTSTPGQALLTLTSSMALPAGPIDFIRLTASVPTGAPYGSKHVLDVTSLQLNSGAIASQDDDGLHIVGYFGDATGNAGYSSADALRIQRVATGLDSGFAAYPLADPVLVADVTANGAISSLDAVRVLQEAVGIDQAAILPIPAGVTPIAASGPDPNLNIPKTFRGRPGDLITVPVQLDLSDGLETADLAISYDPTRLEVIDVQRGSLTADFDLFAVNHNPAAGTIRVGLGRSAGPIEGRDIGSVVEMTFRIRAGALTGATIINLRQNVDTTLTQLNDGGLDLNPDPNNRAGDRLDGLVMVQPKPLARVVDELFRQYGGGDSDLARLLAAVTSRKRGE